MAASGSFVIELLKKKFFRHGYRKYEFPQTEGQNHCSPGAALRIETNELEAFQKQLLAKHYKYARPGIEEMPWGTRDMSIADPFGNRLTFTTGISA